MLRQTSNVLPLMYMDKFGTVATTLGLMALSLATVATARAAPTLSSAKTPPAKVSKPRDTTALWRACFKKPPTAELLGGIALPKGATLDAAYTVAQFASWYADKTGGGMRSYRFTLRGRSQREVGQFFFDQKLVPVDNGVAYDRPRSDFRLGDNARSQLTVSCDTTDEVVCTMDFRFVETAVGASAQPRRSTCPPNGFVPQQIVPRSVVAAALPRQWTNDYRNSTVADWQTFFTTHPATESNLGVMLHSALRFDAVASAAPTQRGGKRGRFTYVFAVANDKIAPIVAWYKAQYPGVEATEIAKGTAYALNINADDQLLLSCEKKLCTMTMSLLRSANTSDSQNQPRHAGRR